MQIIARRDLLLVPDDGAPPSKVQLRLGAPEQKDESAWYAAVEIETASGLVITRPLGGVDGIQAILAALDIAGVELRILGARLGGRMTFLGDDDLGLKLDSPT